MNKKFWTINVYSNRPTEHVGRIDGIKAKCVENGAEETHFGGWYSTKKAAIRDQRAKQTLMLESARKEVELLTAALEA